MQNANKQRPQNIVARISGTRNDVTRRRAWLLKSQCGKRHALSNSQLDRNVQQRLTEERAGTTREASSTTQHELRFA